MIRIIFLTVCVTFASSQHTHTNPHQQKFMEVLNLLKGNQIDYQKILGKMLKPSTHLHHGDDCSWEGEEYRQNFVKRLYNTENIMDSDNLAKLAGSFVNSFAESDYQFCNTAEILVCDRRSRKCVCGDYIYEAIEGKDSSKYVLEWPRKCRWNTDTYCVPDMSNNPTFFMARLTGLRMDYGCKSGTSCKTRNGETCTEEAMTQILRNRPYKVMEALTREKIQLAWDGMKSGKMCSCKTDRLQSFGGSEDVHANLRTLLGLWKNIRNNWDQDD